MFELASLFSNMYMPDLNRKREAKCEVVKFKSMYSTSTDVVKLQSKLEERVSWKNND